MTEERRRPLRGLGFLSLCCTWGSLRFTPGFMLPPASQAGCPRHQIEELSNMLTPLNGQAKLIRRYESLSQPVEYHRYERLETDAMTSGCAEIFLVPGIS